MFTIDHDYVLSMVGQTKADQDQSPCPVAVVQRRLQGMGYHRTLETDIQLPEGDPVTGLPTKDSTLAST